MSFRIGCLVPADIVSPGFTVVVSRAGHVGFVELSGRDGHVDEAVLQALLRARAEFGLALADPRPLLSAPSSPITTGTIARVLLTAPCAADLESRVRATKDAGLEVWVEAVSTSEAVRAEQCGADCIVIKGNESGGRVGEDTSLILLQKVRGKLSTPVFARGGIGLHTAAACLVAGAAGVILDWQLSLCEEAELSKDLRRKIERMDGSETVVLGQELGRRYRVYSRPGEAAAARLADEAAKIEPVEGGSEELDRWQQSVEASIANGELLAVGQDAAFAMPLAQRFRTVTGVCDAIRDAAVRQTRVAASKNVLRAGGPLAQSHGTRYPVVQGPMTRVSDRADFAVAVEAGGGLPVLALALMRGRQVADLLEETREKMAGRPWGIGILGFVPRELREEQLVEVRRCPPPFAVIAGGRPDQARDLEQEGIRTYLHVPSPELLRLYLNNGVRRIILEGRECGGHVGPRTSFVLWESMVRVLLDRLAEEDDGREEYHVLFAGGIHDALSAAMVSAIASPLSERGVRVGVLLGTGYLFTREAVETGAIQAGFQREAIACDETVLLESGVGHATRCANTPFGRQFIGEKRRLMAEGRTPEEIREELERLNLGRLRIASKGIVRAQGEDGGATYQEVPEQAQHADGMFMIGQVAGLRSSVCTIEELHAEVAASVEVLSQWASQFTRKHMAADRREQPADIAIIGMSCLLPGASDRETYWRNILEKVNAISEIPKERWDWKLYFDSDRRAKDKIYSRWGGFIGDRAFDPVAYGMPPNSVAAVEPMQLLTLELVREALNDAGYRDREFDRSRASVVVGTGGGVGELGLGYGFRSMIPHFVDRVGGSMEEAANFIEGLTGSIPEWTEDSFAGLLLNVAAGRVANRFDLGGTNFIVDAACATSLAALRLGAHELETGSSDLVIAAGVDMVQSPFGFLCFSKTHALSPTGQCRTFDESADGIVISEGLAVCVLKRLEDAERDGDRVYAVLKSVGASSDGKDKGLTAPRPAGQVRALERAYQKAGFSADTVGLIEAHGTGTVVGDRTEVESLTTYFHASETNRQTCALGSVKSMIGHTKCTAGFAGLMKAALGLYHQVLPPTIGVTKPNPTAKLEETPFYINTETRPWLERLDGQPRRAGVSAFGFGGTNFHAVLEEYRPNGDAAPEGSPVARRPAELLIWRGETAAEIRSGCEVVGSAIREGSNPLLGDVAAAVCWEYGRKEGGHCLAIVAESVEDLAAKLAAFLKELAGGAASVENPRGVYYSASSMGAGKIGFLFPGQGSQRVDMLRDLAIAFPVVRRVFERADRALADRLPRALSRYVYPPPAFSEQEETEHSEALKATTIAQPALGAADAAMLALLRRLGIEPDLLAGHSYGEFVALYAAGAFSFDDLIRVSELRGRTMVDTTGDNPGTMAAVVADESRVRAAIEGIEGAYIANLNSPNQTVISGTEEGITLALEKLQSLGLRGRRVPVACAFHSPLMEPAREAFSRALREFTFHTPAIPTLSNASAAPYPEIPGEFPAILSDHLTQPVRFADQIRRMYEGGVRVFVEVGPGNVLTNLASRTLQGQEHVAIPMDVGGRNGLVQLAHSSARLAVAGVPLWTQPLFQGRVRTNVSLKDLLDNAKPKPLPPTTWMLTAGQAVPIRKFETGDWGPAAAKARAKAKGAVSVPGAAVPAAARGAVPSRAASASSLQVTNETMTHAEVPPPLPSGEALSILEGHNRLMSKFLETQQRVMLAGLRFGAGGTAGAYEAVATAPVAEERGGLLERSVSPITELRGEDLRATAAVAERVDSTEPAAAPQQFKGVAMPAAPATPALTRDVIEQRLVELVSDRTGYPVDMLALDLDLEADLSVDSIKRVEIFGALQEQAGFEGNAIEGEIETLSRMKTLGEIVEWLAARTGGSVPTAAIAAVAPMEALPAPSRDLQSVAEPRPVELARQVICMREAPLAQTNTRLDLKGCVLIIDDGLGSADQLAEHLDDLGATSEVLPRDIQNERSAAELVNYLHSRRGQVAALIDLAPLAPATSEGSQEGFRARLDTELLTLFHVARFLEEDLRETGGIVLAATRMGGSFGLSLDKNEEWWSGAGAVGGFVKTLAQEWPEVRCKIVDFETRAPLETVLDAIVAELSASDGLIEVGYRGGRQTLAVEPAPAADSQEGLLLDGDAVILVTGGGGGITALTALELAKHGPARFVLTGRSELPPNEEPSYLAGASSDRDIKAALMHQQKLAGGKPTPAEIETEFRRIKKQRVLRQTLSDLRATGASVEYHAVDASQPEEFGALIDQIHERLGRIDGVIHGAGIIEDKLVRDKTTDSFLRVLRPKIDGALTLVSKLRPDTLRFLFFYSSVSGRYGNRGQADYAAANETLNKLAHWLDARWPARVAALNWGPWKTAEGMVSAELAKRFEEAGVQMVTPEAGCRALIQEITAGEQECPEVLYGGPLSISLGTADRDDVSRDAARPLLRSPQHAERVNGSYEVVIEQHPAQDIYLYDHQLDGRPVMPMAMVLEFVVEAAESGWSAFSVNRIRDFQILRGITFEPNEGHTLRLRFTQTAAPANGVNLAFEVHLKGARPALHYRGVVELRRVMEITSVTSLALSDPQPLSMPLRDAYRDWLFHGPLFEAVTEVESLGTNGITARLRTSNPATFFRPTAAGSWAVDPAMIDAGLQLVILWARTYRDETPLPSRLGCFHRLGPPPADGIVRCEVEIQHHPGRPNMVTDLRFFDSQGRLFARLEDMQTACSRALNRLSAGASGAAKAAHV